MQVTLDPALIALHEAKDQAQLRDHLEVATDWSTAIRQERISVLVADELVQELSNLGLFPLRHALKALFEKHHLNETSGHDAATLLLGMLERSKHFEDVVLVEIVATNCEVESSLGASCLCHPAIDSATSHAWTMSAAIGSRTGATHVSGMVSPRPKASSELRGSYQFDSVIFADGFGMDAAAGEYALPLVSSTKDLLTRTDPLLIARDAAAESGDWGWAVAAASIQYLGQEINPEAVRIHRQWKVDVVEPSIMNNDGRLRSALRGAAEIVANAAQQKTHELRESAGPSAQQTSGQWAAWRHSLGGGYRIHYWRGTGGATELCTIDSHDNFLIPSPSSDS